MSDASALPAVTIEKRGDSALIAKVNVKLLDGKELNLLSSILDQASTDSTISRIVVDLERVQLIPSLGLGLLVRISQNYSSRKQELVLAGLQPSVRQVFTITKLDRILKLADTVDDALQEQH